MVLMNQKHEDQALESLTTALKLDPKNQAALFTRGQLYLKAKRPQLDLAVKDLSAAEALDPRNLGARLSLAEALRSGSTWMRRRVSWTRRWNRRRIA